MKVAKPNQALPKTTDADSSVGKSINRWVMIVYW